MYGTLAMLSGALFVGTGLLSLVVTRRYGWRAALSLPMLALGLVVAALWRQNAEDMQHGIDIALMATTFAGPSLLGAFLGVFVGQRWNG